MYTRKRQERTQLCTTLNPPSNHEAEEALEARHIERLRGCLLFSSGLLPDTLLTRIEVLERKKEELLERLGR